MAASARDLLFDDLLARFERRGELGFDPVEERRDRAGDLFDRFLSGVEPREAQQIAHQTFHAQRVAADDLEEAADLRRFRALLALIEQRFDVAAHGGERRAQLVRDVGDEVAADAVGAAQLGDVVHDEHGAGGIGGRDGRAARDDDELGFARERQLETLASACRGAPSRAARRCPADGRSRRSGGLPDRP